MHYDPTTGASSRNRSGSVQGRAVDFDRPRESPFSNSNAIVSVRNRAEDMIVEVETPIMSRGRRVDASDLV